MRCSVAVGLSAAFLLSLIAFAAPQAPERVTAEAKRSTATGATYTAPAGWSIRSSPSMIVLDAPEADSHLVIVELRAADANAAVSAAWSAYRPDFKRPLDS
jgi:hypothetical protein